MLLRNPKNDDETLSERERERKAKVDTELKKALSAGSADPRGSFPGGLRILSKSKKKIKKPFCT